MVEKKEKLKQVVIAHPIPEEQARIVATLKKEGMFHVRHVTHDGLDCLREVVALQPDLLILDTVLDKIDGLEVLRRLKEFSCVKTKCLLLTSYGRYVTEHSACFGADYCLIAPFADRVLAETVRTLVLPSETFYRDEEIDAQTIQILRTIGVPPRLKGYAYVVEAVRILLRDPGLVRRRCVVKELYGVIAQHFGVTLLQVERSMRTLTNKVFDKGEREDLAQYFSPSDVQQAHATNTDFLTTLAYLVRQRLPEKDPANSATNGG